MKLQQDKPRESEPDREKPAPPHPPLSVGDGVLILPPEAPPDLPHRIASPPDRPKKAPEDDTTKGRKIFV